MCRFPRNTDHQSVLLLFPFFLLVVVLFVWIVLPTNASNIDHFVDSSGKQFELIHLSDTADLNLQDMPDPSVALTSEGSIVAVKMSNASGDVVSRALGTSSITAISMRTCRVPHDVLSGPPFLQQLTSVNC